jgi:hypothetical protein
MQIDHLVLHRYGIIIIESKSVTTQIQVNEYGEWIRWFNNQPQGIPSPVLQVQRQGEFLKKYLNASAEILLGKILGLQTYFGAMPFDTLVAISDSGIIKRTEKFPLAEVCKADQITDKIQAIFEKRRNANNIFNFNLKDLGGFSLSEDELSKVTQFLLKHHKPLTNKQVISNISTSEKLSKSPTKSTSLAQTRQEKCRHCQSSNVAVEYGKYGYYFKCIECTRNTSINVVCKVCGDKEKIHKNGRQFYSECKSCHTSTLFYTNSDSKA